MKGGAVRCGSLPLLIGGWCKPTAREKELMEGRCEPTPCESRGNFFTRENGASRRSRRKLLQPARGGGFAPTLH